ncbi:hypothetical protein MPLB_1490022 [Mesorhizobium sp. ORS 3324]|nr:hypothetical protein MPLB_1490022 [Mesorhizobium sp. ORS 3324]
MRSFHYGEHDRFASALHTRQVVNDASKASEDSEGHRTNTTAWYSEVKLIYIRHNLFRVESFAG